MPDPYEAKEHIWMPFIEDVLGVDENTIVIGHSSGAEAAMRLLEKRKALGLVLVCACHTDLGEESERISNYYSRPWEWELIKSNCQWILQYHSTDDHLVPVEEADFVAEKLKSEYYRLSGRSHFFGARDIVVAFDAIKRKVEERDE